MKPTSVYKPFQTAGLQRLLVLILALAGLCSILATGGGGGGDGTVVSTASVGSSSGSSVTPGAMSISASQTSVKSDNSDSSTITVLVLDTNNVPANGISVGFASTGGQISAASSTTDTSGRASITFSAGVSTNGNQTVTITATVSGLAAVQVPVDITGSTVTLASNSTNLTVGAAATEILTITVKDSGGFGVLNAAVTIAIDAASTGAGTLSAASGTTDVNGQLSVTVTGTGAGSLVVKVTSQGSTATKTFTVGTAGSVFAITAPAADPASLTIGNNLTVTVSVPDANLPATIVFASSLGNWVDSGISTSTVNGTVGTNTYSKSLTSATAGTSTVQVYIQPTVAPFTITTMDTVKVAISASVAAAAQVIIQTNTSVVAPSTGGNTHTATLTATVVTGTGQPVGNAAVAFTLANTTGGGEFVSPVVAYTDASGKTTATFNSGTLSSSGNGVTVTASVVGTALNDNLVIVIGGTTASIIVGYGTEIVALSSTMYSLPMSIVVVDSNGNPISGATVSLGAWPLQYRQGTWVLNVVPDPDIYEPNVTATVLNEDANRNLILDAGEDVGPNVADGNLTPVSAAGGSVPSSTTTDSNGIANFSLIYPKSSAVWIQDEVRATTIVLGTENTSTLSFWLPYAEGDADDLPASPWN